MARSYDLLVGLRLGVPFAAWVRARIIVRRARSTLKVLCAKPLASRSSRSAARLKRVVRRRLSVQRGFGGVPPGLMGHAAKREPRFANGFAIHFQRGGDRYQAKA